MVLNNYLVFMKTICDELSRLFFILSFLIQITVYSQNNFKEHKRLDFKNTQDFKLNSGIFQYNNEGLQLGVGFGLYKAGNESANYYNGSGKNNLRRVLIDYPYNYQLLKEIFNYDFHLDSNNLPTQMKYAPTVTLQALSKYNFNENNGIVIEFAYSKHTAADFFTIVIEDPSNTTTEPTVELGKIWGIEERVNLNIGYIRSFGKPKKMKPYIEAGFNINDTKLKDNKAQILTYTYSIVDPTDNIYGYKQGGIGHGFYISPGLIFNLGDAFAAHIGSNLSIKKINLLENPRYSKEWVIYLRLMYKNIFGSDA